MRDRSMGSAEPRGDAALPAGWGRLYVLAWLPYAALYAVVFAVGMRLGPEVVALATLANVLPPAVLGVWVLRRAMRQEWPPPSGARLGWTHAGTAVAYAAASVTLTWVVFLTRDRIVSGVWAPQGWDFRPAAWQLFLALLLYGVLVAVAGAIRLQARLRTEEARAARAGEAAARAELLALSAQLRPHFLFNTLHTLMALVRSDPDRAEEALERFAGLLRYALPDGRGVRAGADEVALAVEWRFVADYLELEALRLGDRLRRTSVATDEALACAIPAFSVQPLVENAVRHAVAPRAAGGRIALAARVEQGTLVVAVEDDGPGLTAEAVPDDLAENGGFGLRSIRERLATLPGGPGSLSLERPAAGGLRAVLRLRARGRGIADGIAGGAR